MRNTAATSFLRSISNTSARPSFDNSSNTNKLSKTNSFRVKNTNDNKNNENIVKYSSSDNNIHNNNNNNNNSLDQTNLSVEVPLRSNSDKNVIQLSELNENENNSNDSWKQTQAKSFLANLSATPTSSNKNNSNGNSFTSRTKTDNNNFFGDGSNKRNSKKFNIQNNQKHQYQSGSNSSTAAQPSVTTYVSSSAPTSVDNGTGNAGSAQSEESGEGGGEEGDISGIRPLKSSLSSSAVNNTVCKPLSIQKEDSTFQYVKGVSAFKKQDPNPSKRTFWTYQNSTPFSISTLFKFEKRKNVLESAVENGQFLIDLIEGKIINNEEGEREESFQHLLDTILEPYDPCFLDDPEIRGVARRKVMNLPCMLTTIVPYTNNKDYKKELNAQFRQKHPDLPESITLSKIRNLKKASLQLALGPYQIIHISTTALAHIYFERLVLKKLATKPNRKALMGTCLALAVKFFESTVNLDSFFEALEDVLGVSKKKVFQNEFVVFKTLEFSLKIDPQHIYSHVSRLLQYYNVSPREYFTPDQYEQLHHLSKIKSSSDPTLSTSS